MSNLLLRSWGGVPDEFLQYYPNCSYLGHIIKNLLTCLRVNPDVAVLCSANFSHFSLVTCLATKLWVDLISGKGSA